MERLPVLLDPSEDESLTSFIARLTDANYLRPRMLRDAKPTLVSLRLLACVSGVPVERLRQMTWLGFTPVIVGSTRSTGWLLRQARWWCPVCTPTSGIMKRSWQLACLPVCLACETLLSLHPDPTTREATPQELQTMASIVARVTASPRDSKAQAWLGRLLRVTRLIATTCDEDWPSTLSATTVKSLNSWGHHPSPEPDSVLQLLTILVSTGFTRREHPLISEGWNRYLHQKSRTIPPTRLPARTNRRKRLPKAIPSTPALSVSRADRNRTHDLAQTVAAVGVLPEHIPSLVPTANNVFLPPQELWSDAEELALSIHMLLNPNATGAPGYLSEAFRDLGLPHKHPTIRLARLERGGVTTPDAEHILAATHRIATLKRVNYQQRRTTLKALHQLPRLPRASADSDVARGWIWVYLTHGRIVWTSPAWAQSSALMPTAAVFSFHQNMALKQRHELAEKADQLWQWLTAGDMITWESARNGHSVETVSHALGH